MQKDYNAKWTSEQQKIKDDIIFQVPEGYDDRLDHFTNFFDSVRTGKLVIKDAEFGFRATAPAL
jgi:histidinol dehydrogenase